MRTVKQIAGFLTVSETVVYRLIDAGALKAHRIGIGRGTIRVSDQQLEQYLAAIETKDCKRPPKNESSYKHLQF